MSWLFKVSGKRTFPLDMLRHDRCFPADSDAVHSLFLALTVPQIARTVSLCGEMRPNDGRWKALGWDVTEAREINLGGRRRRPRPTAA